MMRIASRRTFVGLGGGVVAAALSASASNATSSVSPAVPAPESALGETRYRTIDVNGWQIFCREAGPAGAPVVLLLHGFPTSSRMFRNLIPLLADKYRVIAPDHSERTDLRRADRRSILGDRIGGLEGWIANASGRGPVEAGAEGHSQSVRRRNARTTRSTAVTCARGPLRRNWITDAPLPGAGHAGLRRDSDRVVS